MRIEELPTVQRILNRIRDIESLQNRFVKESPVQNRQESFDSILKTEGEKSASAPKIEPWRRDSRGNWEGIEPTLAEIIRKESEKNHLDPSLVQSVIKAESGFKTDAISPKGACDRSHATHAVHGQPAGSRRPFRSGGKRCGRNEIPKRSSEQI